jgi:hypothetical protein
MEQKKASLLDRLRSKRIELERIEKKYKTISKIQPAHVTKFNQALNELR